MHEVLDRLLGEEAPLQLVVRLAQQLAAGGSVGAGGEQRRQARQQRPGSRGQRAGGLFQDLSIAGTHRIH